MRILHLAVAALIMAGCAAPGGSQEPGGEAALDADGSHAPLPASFSKSTSTAGGNVMIGVGGRALSHEVVLETAAVLSYLMQWDVPTVSVELRVLQGGKVVDSEDRDGTQPGSIERNVELAPGKYMIQARAATGVSALQELSLSGSFKASSD